MAFIRTKMSGAIGGGSNAPTMFTYVSTDDAVVGGIDQDGYFTDLNKTIKVNDIFAVVGTDGAAMLRVTSILDGVVGTGGFV